MVACAQASAGTADAGARFVAPATVANTTMPTTPIAASAHSIPFVPHLPCTAPSTKVISMMGVFDTADRKLNLVAAAVLPIASSTTAQ